MAPEVIQVLIDRVPIHEVATLIPQKAYIYRRHPVKGFYFPGLIKKGRIVDHPSDKYVTGILYRDLTESELQRLDYFEDIEYTKDHCQVKLQSCGTEEESQVYLWTASIDCLDQTQEWSYENFRTHNLKEYIDRTVHACRKQLDSLAISNDTSAP